MKNKIVPLVHSIVDLNSRLGEIDWKEYDRQENELFAKIKLLDEEAGDGVAVGKHLQFPVADGYAHYIITKVRKNDVVVEHLPFGDAYHFQGCYLDNQDNLVIPRQVVERYISHQTAMKSLFSTPKS